MKLQSYLVLGAIGASPLLGQAQSARAPYATIALARTTMSGVGVPDGAAARSAPAAEVGLVFRAGARLSPKLAALWGPGGFDRGDGIASLEFSRTDLLGELRAHHQFVGDRELSFSAGPGIGLLVSCKQMVSSASATISRDCDQVADVSKVGALVSISVGLSQRVGSVAAGVTARVVQGVSNLIKGEETRSRSVFVGLTISRQMRGAR